MIKNTEKELVEDYKITKFPKIIIEDVINLENNTPRAKPQRIVYKKEIEYEPIDKYLKKYARNNKITQEDIEDFKEKEREIMTPLLQKV